MVILGYIVMFLVFSFHLLIPFNSELYINLSIISYNLLTFIYFIGLLVFIRLICLLIKMHKFDYDILFLVMLIWLSNLISYIYFHIFESITLSFFSILICFISLICLLKKAKKINKSYSKYLIILLGLYFYLLIILFKFI